MTTPTPPLADVLAGMPEVWRALLATHVDDGHGQCVSCRRSSTGSAHRWPCTLHASASHAQRLAERGQSLRRPG